MKVLKRGVSIADPSAVNGHTIRYTDGDGIEYGYDAGGRKVRQVDRRIDPSGKTTIWHYDDEYNRLAYRIDDNGIETVYNYGKDNQLSTIEYKQPDGTKDNIPDGHAGL